MTDNTVNLNTEAHYSTEMKVKRPQLNIAEAPSSLPVVHTFSDIDASSKLRGINNDIYQGAVVNTKPKTNKSIDKIIKKEKSKRGFDRGLFFKIFGTLAAVITLVASRNRIRSWFKSIK